MLRAHYFILQLKACYFLLYIQDTLVGEACLKWRHQLDISYPVNNGIVQNWDDMGHVWDHVFFSELKVTPSTCFVLTFVC